MNHPHPAPVDHVDGHHRDSTLATARRLAVASAVGMTVAAATGLLAAGDTADVAATSVRGEAVALQGDGLYQFDTVFKAAGNVGSDLASSLVAVPLLVVAIVASRRGSQWARLLLLGSLTWPLYLYATLSLGTAFNPLFLLYVAAFSVSLFAFALAGSAVDLDPSAARLAGLPSRGIGAFVIACGALMFVVWTMPLVAALVSGAPPKLLQTNTTMVTDALDLAIITPSCVVGGVLLLRGRLSAGYRIVTPLLLLLCVLGPAIVAQTVVQLSAGIHFEPPEIVGPLAGFVILSAVATVITVKVLRCLATQPPARP